MADIFKNIPSSSTADAAAVAANTNAIAAIQADNSTDTERAAAIATLQTNLAGKVDQAAFDTLNNENATQAELDAAIAAVQAALDAEIARAKAAEATKAEVVHVDSYAAAATTTVEPGQFIIIGKGSNYAATWRNHGATAKAFDAMDADFTEVSRKTDSVKYKNDGEAAELNALNVAPDSSTLTAPPVLAGSVYSTIDESGANSKHYHAAVDSSVWVLAGGIDTTDEWIANTDYTNETFIITPTQTTAVDIDGNALEQDKPQIMRYRTPQTSGASLTLAEIALMETVGFQTVEQVYIAQPMNEATTYDFDTYLSEPGQRDFIGLTLSGGKQVDGTYNFMSPASPAITFQVWDADGTVTGIAANTAFTRTGKNWTAYRSADGTLIRLIEQGAGSDVGETVEIGQATFTYNSGGAIQGGSSGAAYNTSNYTFTIDKDGDYWLDCSCLQDVTLPGGGSTSPVGGTFYVGTTLGASDVAVLQMGTVKIAYDDDNRDNQDVQTVSDKVKVTLTAGTYYYYMQTANPQSIAGSRQAHNLRGKLNWIGKATGTVFIKKEDVLEKNTKWVEVFNGSATIPGNLGWNNIGAPQSEITGALGEEMLIEFGDGTVDSVHLMMANGRSDGRRASNNVRVDAQILAGGQIQVRASDAGGTGIASISVRKDSDTVTMPDTVEVDITGIADGDAIVWDAANSKFVKGAVATGAATGTAQTFDVTGAFHNLSAAPLLGDKDVLTLTNTGGVTGSPQLVGLSQSASMPIGGRAMIVNDTGLTIQTDLPPDGGATDGLRNLEPGASVVLFYTGSASSGSKWVANFN